jgi:hypothetical protein
MHLAVHKMGIHMYMYMYMYMCVRVCVCVCVCVCICSTKLIGQGQKQQDSLFLSWFLLQSEDRKSLINLNSLCFQARIHYFLLLK